MLIYQSLYYIYVLIFIIFTNSQLDNLNYGKYSNLKIYVYDDEPWRIVSTASFKPRDSLELMDNSLNNGAGPVINRTQGSYHTDQYQLFSLFFHRILKDPRRTYDPNNATTFFIPYDLSTDCAYYKNCSNSKGICFDFRKCPLAPLVEELLLNSVHFNKSGGLNHLMIVGMNYAMDHYIGKPKCKSLLRGICRNCTKFAIDDYSFMYGDDEGILARGDYWYAVPFPSNFHWTRFVKRPFPWENDDRPVLVSYIGTGNSYYGPAKRLRGSLIHYCGLHPNLCIHQTYGKEGTRSSFLVEGYNPLQISSRSIFCFQPIGDLMTRKGLFDSLVQGCIPVVFDPLTAEVMYTWHWEEWFWKEIIINIPFHPVAFRYSDPVLFLDQYRRNNSEIVRKKLDLIKSRVFELQYSLDGRHYKSFDTIEGASVPSDGDNWPLYEDGTPMRDAYDIALDHALGWHSGRESRFRNATVPECWNGSVLDVKNNICVKSTEKSKTT